LLPAPRQNNDAAEIPIENAYMLAKIPRSMQRDYVDRAKIMPPREFRPLAAACVKQFREAVKQGKMDAFYSDAFRAQAINPSQKCLPQFQAGVPTRLAPIPLSP
jgi:hypothetical protein